MKYVQRLSHYKTTNTHKKFCKNPNASSGSPPQVEDPVAKQTEPVKTKAKSHEEIVKEFLKSKRQEPVNKKKQIAKQLVDQAF